MNRYIIIHNWKDRFKNVPGRTRSLANTWCSFQWRTQVKKLDLKCLSCTNMNLVVIKLGPSNQTKAELTLICLTLCTLEISLVIIWLCIVFLFLMMINVFDWNIVKAITKVSLFTYNWRTFAINVNNHSTGSSVNS